MDRIEEVLQHVFVYYSSPQSSSSRRVLKATRFQKLTMDGDIIDQNLPTVAVDLIYRRICGSSECMTFDKFLDAMVQVALQKYPSEVSPHEALFRLYNERLSSFSAPGGLLHRPEIHVSVLSVIDQSELLSLYQGYFQHELNQSFVPRFSSIDASSKKAFLDLLIDYDVCPSLVEKSTVFQIYRQVTTLAFLPSGLGVNCGTFFSFNHFLICFLQLSRSVFPNPAESDSVCLTGLLMHMDLSAGKAKARLKSVLVPDKIAQKIHRAQKKIPPKRPLVLPSARRPVNVVTAVLNDPLVLECLSHFELGIQAQFHHYSSSSGAISASQFRQFAAANGLAADSADAVFGRLTANSTPTLDLGAFRLALVLLADETQSAPLLNQKIVALFAHMNKQQQQN